MAMALIDPLKVLQIAIHGPASMLALLGLAFTAKH
jgi:hypothetical protein